MLGRSLTCAVLALIATSLVVNTRAASYDVDTGAIDSYLENSGSEELAEMPASEEGFNTEMLAGSKSAASKCPSAGCEQKPYSIIAEMVPHEPGMGITLDKNGKIDTSAYDKIVSDLKAKVTKNQAAIGSLKNRVKSIGARDQAKAATLKSQISALKLKNVSLRKRLHVVEKTPGPVGKKGYPGRRGRRGPKGYRGKAGKRGKRGATGKPGRKGPRGPNGLPGRNGKAGRPGATGPRGNRGPSGPRGARGAKGAKGPTGFRGPRGIKGRRGPRGKRGRTGATGAPGIIGRRGIKGPKGLRGRRGPRGFRGWAGKNGKNGKTGIRGRPGFPGHRGPKGARGPRGFRGHRGPPGFKGNRGKKGSTGATGFRGMRGPRGFRGLRGAKGFPGHHGRNGRNGIAGKPGRNGKNGKNGKPGRPGPGGPRGARGRRGRHGRNGRPGFRGHRGSRGHRGHRGPRGRRGHRGPRGYRGRHGRTRVIRRIHVRLSRSNRLRMNRMRAQLRRLTRRYHHLRRHPRVRHVHHVRHVHRVIHRIRIVRRRSKCTMMGTVINYVNNRHVHHALVKFKNAAGRVVGHSRTNSRGHFAINVGPGKYSAYVYKRGFVGVPVKLAVRPRQRRGRVALGMSPKFRSAGAVRFVLTWGNHPRDLDSHLTLPGGKCKVIYFHRKCSGRKLGLARLDLDATRGHGPETITIAKPIKGSYSYSVKQFSHDGNFAHSHAKVMVFTGHGVKVFRAKKAAQGKSKHGKIVGKIWKVFKWSVPRNGARGSVKKA